MRDAEMQFPGLKGVAKGVPWAHVALRVLCINSVDCQFVAVRAGVNKTAFEAQDTRNPIW